MIGSAGMTSAPKSDDSPLISVIVAADASRAAFPGELRAFLDQTAGARSFELIVVDWQGGPSHQHVVDALRAERRAPTTKYARSPERGRAALNNLGVAHAVAPILCFCADDFIPGSGYVASHLEYHTAHPATTRVAIGAGVSPDELRQASPFLRWLEDTGELFGANFRRTDTALPPGFFYIGNASFKRELYDAAGPFDERLPFAAYDDLDYGQRLLRLGTISELVPTACCLHDHLIFLEDREQQMRLAGASLAILNQGRFGSRGHWQLFKVHLGTLRGLLTRFGHEAPRATYWRSRLASAFLTGYRRGNGYVI